jgi:hypothetical protein
MNDKDMILRGEAIDAVVRAVRGDPIPSVGRVMDLIRAIPAAPPRPMKDAPRDVDASEIERGGKRWHGEDVRVVAVRWEPYKPGGQRQMKAKGRWQEMVGSGDYWRWNNCNRPENLRPHPPEGGSDE